MDTVVTTAEESSDAGPQKCSQLVLTKVQKWANGGMTAFSAMVPDQWEKHRERRLDLSLTPGTKINSKQTIDSNVKHKTLQLLGERIQEKLFEI